MDLLGKLDSSKVSKQSIIYPHSSSLSSTNKYSIVYCILIQCGCVYRYTVKRVTVKYIKCIGRNYNKSFI